MKIDATGPSLEINLNAIRENWYRIQAFIGKRCRCAAVLKGDAYGLGLVPVGSFLNKIGCRDFIVGSLEEAINLKSVAPTAAIAILYPDLARDISEYNALGLLPVLNDTRNFHLWLESAPELSPILRVDTGLSTLGVDWFEALDLWRRHCVDVNQVHMIMSHVVPVIDRAHQTLKVQKSRFDEIRCAIPAKFFSLSASRGVLLGQEYHYDLVRSGDFLLGFVVDNGHPNLTHNAVRLEAPIMTVRNVTKGESLGYRPDCVAGRDMQVAIVHIGYAHGLSASKFCHLTARLNTHEIKSVGDIEMEKTIFDVTHIPPSELSKSTTVQLLGDDNRVDQLANQLYVNPNDLMIRLGKCVRRRYVDKAISHSSGRLR